MINANITNYITVHSGTFSINMVFDTNVTDFIKSDITFRAVSGNGIKARNTQILLFKTEKHAIFVHTTCINCVEVCITCMLRQNVMCAIFINPITVGFIELARILHRYGKNIYELIVKYQERGELCLF